MRYPNLRYGNPAEFAYYVRTGGDDIAAVARTLRRDERTIKDWLSGRQRIPFWVPELLRLRRFEADAWRRRNGYSGAALATVTHEGQLELRRPVDVKKPQPITALRLDDFDQPAVTSICA
jgi:hypothetical protein